MWIAAARACALAGLDRADDARAELARAAPIHETNRAALTQALLCLDDADAAETVVLKRLQDSPGGILSALQDYRAPRRGSIAIVDQRLLALRERPKVREAIERVGRIMALPLARGD